MTLNAAIIITTLALSVGGLAIAIGILVRQEKKREERWRLAQEERDKQMSACFPYDRQQALNYVYHLARMMPDDEAPEWYPYAPIALAMVLVGTESDPSRGKALKRFLDHRGGLGPELSDYTPR